MIPNSDFTFEGHIGEKINPCDEVNYCVASYIQPFAMLVVVDALFTIKKISANATMLGELPKNLLEKNFLHFIEYTSHLTIFNAESELKLKGRNDHRYICWKWNKSLLVKQEYAEGFVFYSDDLLCFEIVLSEAPASNTLDYFRNKTQAAYELAMYDGDVSNFATLLTRHIQVITGFDRLYCLRFDSQKNGMVIGESSNKIYSSLIAHYFPSTDIPTNLHAVYCLNRFRHYPNRNYVPVPLLELNNQNEELDLSLSISRQVGTSHLKYLENMGVEASVSFSIVIEGKLWGLVGGHHSLPKLLALQHLVDIQNLVELFASKIQAITELNQRDRLTQRLNIVIDFTQNFKRVNCELNCFAQKNINALKGLMQADGIIWVQDNKIGSQGVSKSNILPLLNFAKLKISEHRVYSTNSLIQHNSMFELFVKEASGMLVLSLNCKDLIIWLRVERLQQKKWGGNPNIPINRDENGVLNPRNSFATWIELIRNTSLPWDSTDVDVASEMRIAFSGVKLNYLLGLESDILSLS